MSLNKLVATALVALVAVHGAARLGAHASQEPEPEEFTAFAVNMGSYVVGTTANLIFTVNRWSTQAERDGLFAILKEKGQQGFLDAVQRNKRVGSLRTPESVGYDLRVALQEPGKDGGRRVLLTTDRPIAFGEATRRPPSIDYPFTVVEMQLTPEGKGEGTMSVAARFVPAGRTVLVENFDTAPVRLNRIESRKLTKR